MPELQRTVDLRALFLECLSTLEAAFHLLAGKVPPPRLTERDEQFYHRYAEQTIQQALILKLARFVTGLHSVVALLDRGLLQDEGAIQRILDEVGDDIRFLLAPTSETHERFLAAFWAEVEPTVRAKKPDTPPRRKIRSQVVNHLNPPNPSSLHDAGESLSTAYSGYVHGSAQNIMDMYGGDPPQFHVSGMRGTPRMATSVKDARNMFYRGIVAMALVANAIGEHELAASLKTYLQHFSDACGGDFLPN